MQAEGIVTAKEAVEQAIAQAPAMPESVSQETPATSAPEQQAQEAAPAAEEKKPGSYAREWARLQKIERAAKAAEAKASEERAAAAEEREEAARLLELVKKDPAEFLMQNGGPDAYAAATRKLLDQRETPEERLARLEEENKRLNGLIPTIKDEIRNELNTKTANEAWESYTREIDTIVATEQFADIADLGLADETKQLAVEWYRTHGEAITARQAAEKMQEYLDVNYFPALAKSDRLKQKLAKMLGLAQPEATPAPQAAAPKAKQATVTNKLTNNAPTGNIFPEGKVLSNREETRLALQALGVPVKG